MIVAAAGFVNGRTRAHAARGGYHPVIMARTSFVLRVAALTHLGRHRYANEDCIAAGSWSTQEPALEPRLLELPLDEPRICLVADGMGGHPAGDVASRLAIERLAHSLPAAYGDAAALRHALSDANAAMFEAQDRNPDYHGMGTTIAGLVIGPNQAFVLHVGDSRVYRIEGERLVPLTEDDTASMIVRVLGIEVPSRSLVQCLGGYPGNGPIDPHVRAEPAVAGAYWLVCSDGLHDMLDQSEMEACLCDAPEAVVEDLFNRAMDAGGRDNISIIAARIVDSA